MRLIRSARWLMLAVFLCAIPATSNAGVFISINFGPPVLPVYEQPICPQPNLIWMPGYWAYGEDGYFWVPGAWVPPPFEGGLWTPPYWGWSSGLYVFHPGYWGRHVGYYGGVNYGYGYGGIGFTGGEWRGHEFAYNRAVMHVDERYVHNTYEDRRIVERGYVARDNHVAYSGGPGGIRHPMSEQERFAEREQHTAPTSFQAQHIQAARSNHQSYVKFNGGRPSNFAVARPLPAETHAAPAMSPSGGGQMNRLGAAQVGGRPNYQGAPANGASRLPSGAVGGNPNPTYQERPNGNFAPRPNAGVQRPNYNGPPRNLEMRPAPPAHNNNVMQPPHNNVAPRPNEMQAPHNNVMQPPHNNVAPRPNEMRQVAPQRPNPEPRSNERPAQKPRPEHQ